MRSQLFCLILSIAVPAAVAASSDMAFRAMPSADSIRETMKQLSARPHHIGSRYDKENAEWILAKYKSWGFEAHIETFNVLFPTPKERVVELIEPVSFKAGLQ